MTGVDLSMLLASYGEHPLVVLAAILAASLLLEDAAVVGAALLAAQGVVDPLATGAVLCIGTSMGDFALVLAGRRAHRLRWVRRRMEHPRFQRAARWAGRRRWQALFLARFVPGLRLPTYIAGGLLGFPLAGSATVIALATLAWTPTLFVASLYGWRAIEDALLLAAVATGLCFAVARGAMSEKMV